MTWNARATWRDTPSGRVAYWQTILRDYTPGEVLVLHDAPPLGTLVLLEVVVEDGDGSRVAPVVQGVALPGRAGARYAERNQYVVIAANDKLEVSVGLASAAAKVRVIAVVVDGFSGGAHTEPGPGRHSLFGEHLTVKRTSVLNLKPSWGTSRLRDAVTGNVDLVDGETRLRTGGAGEEASVRTLRRGQYHAGTTAEAGMGIRIPVAPTGDEVARWGYLDATNGLGWGVDAAGPFVFRRRAGVDEITRRADWTFGPPDFDLADGHIFQIDFTWYGYGDALFLAYPQASGGARRQVPCHLMTFGGEATLIDPNQPLTAQVEGGDGFTLLLGGRQFSVRGEYSPQTRPGSQSVASVSITAAANVWVPLVVLRKKATFAGRPNSVLVSAEGLLGQADDDAEFRITFDAQITGGTWSAPSDHDAGETAMEVQTGEDLGTITDAGLALIAAPASGTNQATGNVAVEDRVAIGDETVIVLWARRLSGSATSVSAVLRWREDW